MGKEQDQDSFLEKLLSLPTLPLRAGVEENQKIKGKKGEVEYTIIKEEVFPKSGTINYSLYTLGPKDERKRFLKEIIEILGEPFNIEHQFPEDTGFYTFWKADEVEERLEKLTE